MEANEAARAIRAKSRKVLTLPTCGVEIEIRKVTGRDFISGGLAIPTDAVVGGPSMSQSEIEKALKRGDIEKYAAAMEAIVSRAVISPRVIIDDAIPAGEGEINLFDIGDDVIWLVEQIFEFSGLGAEASAAKKFREGQPENADNAGCPSDEIQTNAT